MATLAGATSGPGVGDVDGVSYEARFNSPRGVEAVSDDKVYVADALNNKVPFPPERVLPSILRPAVRSCRRALVSQGQSLKTLSGRVP